MRYLLRDDTYELVDAKNPFVIEVQLGDGPVKTLSNPRVALAQDNPATYYKERVKVLAFSIEFVSPVWKRHYVIGEWDGDYDEELKPTYTRTEFTQYFNPVTQQWDTKHENAIRDEIFQWATK